MYVCRWVTEQIKLSDAANVVVLYASAYGNTAALAQASYLCICGMSHP